MERNHVHGIRRVGSLLLVLALLLAFLIAPSNAQFASSGSAYIVQSRSADSAAALVQKVGGAVTSRLEVIHGVGALLTPPAALALKSLPGVTAVTSDQRVQIADVGGDGLNAPETDYPEVVGADVTWQSGDYGQDVTVAVVDTGLGMHRGIQRDINGKDGRVVGWVDFVEGKDKPTDPNGHGSHVAGIIANSQVGSDGEWNGVAPGVQLVGVRVLDEQGQGTYENVIQGIQWVIDHKDQYNIRVMNLSLISPVQSPYWADPINQAVMKAWAEGIVVVVAAGNGGPKPMTIGVPGNNPYVITVGAFTDNSTPTNWGDDYITPFSAAGPTLDGFVKPDLVAPGAHIVSTMLPSSELVKIHEANRVKNQYFSMAGTSQSAAVSSGVAALVLSRHPELTPDQVKYRMLVTAFPWVDPQTTDTLYSMWQQGAGRINAPDAANASIAGSANIGLDIAADLDGTRHYEGYSYYDETTGQFKLHGDYGASGSTYGVWSGAYGVWSGAYGVWSGTYGVWSGAYGVWSGTYGVWSGTYGVWSGGYGVWSGTYGVWSGAYGVWSGGYGVWSGGYGVWSGQYGVWSGSYLPWLDTVYSDPAFVDRFMSGNGPDATTTVTSLNGWVEEP